MIMRITRFLSPLIVLAGLALLCIAGCGKKEVVPLKVGEMTDYKDPGYGFHIEYPAEWLSNAEVGRALFFSEQDVDKKFLDPIGPYPNGALISVIITKTSNAGAVVDSTVAGMKSIGMQVGPAEQVTVSGLSASKYHYAARYEGGTATGDHVYLMTDTSFYDLWFAGFADFYQEYKDIFTASLNSFRLPRPAVRGTDEMIPSSEYVEETTQHFRVSLPDNFQGGTVKGPFESSSEYSNKKRLDCSIRLDMFDAKHQTVDKVFDQNRSKYRGTGTGRMIIGGDQSMFISYAATKDVSARAYFLVHGNSAWRITTTWYNPDAKDYIPAFEKILGSIKWK